MQDKDYCKATGMLNYISNGTRPDISFIYCQYSHVFQQRSASIPLMNPRQTLYRLFKDYQQSHYNI